MKSISVKTIALVLTLIFALSAAAFAASGRVPMDGFDINTNQSGSYHGILFSYPSYYKQVNQDGGSVVFQASGVTVGGFSPAYLSFDVLDGPYTLSEFESLSANFISRITGGATILGRKDDAYIANYPAKAVEYEYTDEDGNWNSIMFLIHNSTTAEILRVHLIQNKAASIDFSDDFLKIMQYAQQTGTASGSNNAPAQQQVSAKVKELCDTFISSVNRVKELIQTVDLDRVGLVSGALLAAEVGSLYENITNFYNVNTAGWSSADVAYYNRVSEAVGDDVAMTILSWLDQATAGFLNW